MVVAWPTVKNVLKISGFHNMIKIYNTEAGDLLLRGGINKFARATVGSAGQRLVRCEVSDPGIAGMMPVPSSKEFAISQSDQSARWFAIVRLVRARARL